MATPGKFENKKRRIWKLFLSDTNAFFKNILDWLDCNSYFWWFKVIFLLKWRFPLSSLFVTCLYRGLDQNSSPKQSHNSLTFCIKLRLRCFDTVYQRPYRYFAIALKVVFSLSDRYKVFTSNWLWIEIWENVVSNKTDITMTTINKKLWNW